MSRINDREYVYIIWKGYKTRPRYRIWGGEDID